MGKKILACIVAVAMIMMGVIYFTADFGVPESEPVSLSSISGFDIENNTIYRAKELVLVDVFAHLESNSVQYFLVEFVDSNGQRVVANMPMNKSSELWTMANDYLDDPNMYIGDCVLDGYIKTENFYEGDNGELARYFKEGVADYKAMLDGEFVNSISSVQFEYVCDKYGDYTSAARGAANVGKVMGVLVILGAIAIIYFVVIRKPKKKSAPVAAPKFETPVSTGFTAAPVPTEVTPPVPVQEPAPAEPQAPVQTIDPATITQQLHHYKALKDAGFMTEEEFETERKELLRL